MNREILFRGKTKENGDWVFGYLYYNQWHDSYHINSGNYNSSSYIVIPGTIGQFTGLLDKEGNKIFEGDIVKYKYGTIATVNFGNGSFYGYDGNATSSDEAHLLLFPDETPFESGFEIKITGNIHENK